MPTIKLQKIYIVELHRPYSESNEILLVSGNKETAESFARECPLNEPARLVVGAWYLDDTTCFESKVIKETR